MDLAIGEDNVVGYASVVSVAVIHPVFGGFRIIVMHVNDTEIDSEFQMKL